MKVNVKVISRLGKAKMNLIALLVLLAMSLNLSAQTSKPKTTAKRKATTTRVATKKKVAAKRNTSGTKKSSSSTAKKKVVSTTRTGVKKTSSVQNKPKTTSVASPASKPTTRPVQRQAYSTEQHATASKASSFQPKKEVGRMFRKGKVVVSAGVGYGLKSYKGGESGSMFAQKISVEFGIANVGKKGSFGLGFTIANAYGDSRDGKIAGTYDYTYTSMMQHYHRNSQKRWVIDTKTSTHHREGAGSADATLKKDDIKFLLTLACHHQLTDKLEGYAAIGGGVALLNGLVSNPHNYDGLDKANKNEPINKNDKSEQWANSYSYDDFDHIDFSGNKFTKVAPAAAAYVGVRYHLSSRFSLYGEVGMTAAAFKESYGHNFDLCTMGCSFDL